MGQNGWIKKGCLWIKPFQLIRYMYWFSRNENFEIRIGDWLELTHCDGRGWPFRDSPKNHPIWKAQAAFQNWTSIQGLFDEFQCWVTDKRCREALIGKDKGGYVCWYWEEKGSIFFSFHRYETRARYQLKTFLSATLESEDFHRSTWFTCFARFTYVIHNL